MSSKDNMIGVIFMKQLSGAESSLLDSIVYTDPEEIHHHYAKLRNNLFTYPDEKMWTIEDIQKWIGKGIQEPYGWVCIGEAGDMNYFMFKVIIK